MFTIGLYCNIHEAIACWYVYVLTALNYGSLIARRTEILQVFR